MKLLTAFIAVLLFTACKKETNTTNTPSGDPVPSGTVLVQGNLVGSGGHNVSGVVKVYSDNGNKTVRLENFSTTNGPDLKVYLSKDINASAFINAGNLRSTIGNQNYSLSGMPDFSQYRYVLIWCQQFGVLFGSAQVQ
ncbi:MAG: DM13 domain-containing protein [Chitinophagaceae bacterium]|nr:DM13 domain-containing protein [Chitinophagaceae bacterium]